MADLRDLIKESFSEKPVGEAHELLRQIRLSRRTPPKKKVTTKKKAKAKKKVALKPSQMTPEMAKKMIELLKERQK